MIIMIPQQIEYGRMSSHARRWRERPAIVVIPIKTKRPMINNHYDPTEFEKEWQALAVEICKAVYRHAKIQESKAALVKNGFLNLEEKSSFIDICDTVKYEVIYGRYGSENSEGYKKFSEYWKQWFQGKGVESEKNRGQRNSVDHIMFGSTPDPVVFLTKFDEEIGIKSN